MSAAPTYDVAVVGAGPAGLTGALYTTRLGHRTAVFDSEGGRHDAVVAVHNLLGVSPQTAGSDLAAEMAEQLVAYGADYFPDTVTEIERVGREPHRFRLTADRAEVTAGRVLLATGFTDVPPAVPGLTAFTGRGLHYCPHCDAYSLGDRPTYVLGHSDHAATVALLMLNVTGDVDLLLDDTEPTWSESVARQVEAHPLRVDDRAVAAPVPEPDSGQAGSPEQWLDGLRFADGEVREYAGGFAVYGTDYNDELARQLGCDLDADGAVAVDEDRRTSVEGVYAAGDLTHGQNQTTIALGDGAYAGIALHKDLRAFPVAADELEEVPDAPGMAPDLRANMRYVNARGLEAGLRPDER